MPFQQHGQTNVCMCVFVYVTAKHTPPMMTSADLVATSRALVKTLTRRGQI